MGRNGKDKGSSKKGKESIEEFVEQVTEKGKALFSEGLEGAKHLLEKNAKTLKTKADQLTEKPVEELAENIKSFVQEKPLQSLGIVFGVGFLLGYFLKSD